MLHWSRVLPVLVVLSVVSDTLAAAGQPTDRATDPQPAATVLSQYCFQCHDAQTQTAGINLEGLILQRPLVRNHQTWTRVIDAVEIGKMPPSNSRQLTDLERETLVERCRQFRLLRHQQPRLRTDSKINPSRTRQHAQRPNWSRFFRYGTFSR